VYSPGEGGEIDESDMGGGQVNLVPRKLACLARYSSELEEDCIAALGELVGQSIARSMARAEDLAGFLGDGTSTYWSFQGIVGALRAVDETIANIKSLVVGSGNAYSELTLADFRKVCGILPMSADMGARWFMHKSFFYNVVLPLLWAETAGQPIIGTPTYFEQGPSKFLLGYPVEFTPAMPKAEANSQICALLADLRLGAFLGERRTLNIARSDHVHFSTDEIAIRGLERISINAYGVGDTTDAGPICGLITAAS
jgi:HK97 family phage major capsid protein